MAAKLKAAGFTDTMLKGYLLRIGGATTYANAGPDGAVIAGFMGLWVSGSRWD